MNHRKHGKCTVTKVIVVLFIISQFLPLIAAYADDVDKKEIGTWSIEDYSDHDGINDLDYAHFEAYQWYQYLGGNGYSREVRNLDDDAEEAHWECATFGGDDTVDDLDAIYFTGHGFSVLFAFNLDTDGDDECERFVSPFECEWGEDDLEWIYLHCCSALDEGDKTDWNYAFDGLHGICGFDTVSYVWSDGRTGYYTAYYIVQGYSVGDAWKTATENTQFSNVTAAIYRAQIWIDSQVYDYYDEELDEGWIDYTDPWVSLYGIIYTSWDGEC